MNRAGAVSIHPVVSVFMTQCAAMPKTSGKKSPPREPFVFNFGAPVAAKPWGTSGEMRPAPTAIEAVGARQRP